MSEQFLPSILVDCVFKYVFGQESNKELLILFLNDFSVEFRTNPIVDLHIIDPFNLKKFDVDKLSIVDVKVITKNGTRVNVELQLDNKGNYLKRAIYYADRIYVDQLGNKQNYRKINPVKSINILNFCIFPDDNSYHSFVFKDYFTGFVLEPILKEITFLELPKVKDNDEQIKKWHLLIASKNQDEIEKIAKKNKGIRMALDSLHDFGMNPQARSLYDLRLQVRRDTEEALETAKMKGEQDGENRGIKKGIKKGIKRGQNRAKLKFAQDLLKEGFELAQVAKLTKLSQDAIRKKLNMG